MQILGRRGSSTNDSWHQKTRVPGLSRGTVCVILCLAVLIQHRRVTDRYTDTRRRLISAPHIASAVQVKTDSKGMIGGRKFKIWVT